jgi:hypothetical protein
MKDQAVFDKRVRVSFICDTLIQPPEAQQSDA